MSNSFIAAGAAAPGPGPAGHCKTPYHGKRPVPSASWLLPVVVVVVVQHPLPESNCRRPSTGPVERRSRSAGAFGQRMHDRIRNTEILHSDSINYPMHNLNAASCGPAARLAVRAALPIGRRFDFGAGLHRADVFRVIK